MQVRCGGLNPVSAVTPQGQDSAAFTDIQDAQAGNMLRHPCIVCRAIRPSLQLCLLGLAFRMKLVQIYGRFRDLLAEPRIGHFFARGYCVLETVWLQGEPECDAVDVRVTHDHILSCRQHQTHQEQPMTAVSEWHGHSGKPHLAPAIHGEVFREYGRRAQDPIA